MRLAVVIPVYNHARFLPRTLESVLGQTRRPDRIIVIDDGSTDDSLVVARPFAAQGVEIIAQENRGVSATVRRLLALAAEDCDLIATLDSDDVLAPERFAQCLPVFERDPGAQLLVTGLRMIDENGQPLAPDHPRRKWMEAVWSRWEGPETDLIAWLGQANFVVSNSNFIARRAFFQTHSAKPYRFCYDYYLLIRAALAESLRVLPEPLLDYRVHGHNTMNTRPAPLMRELLRLWLDLYHDLAPSLAHDAALRQRFARLARAGWNNVSAFHAGVFQALLAQAAALKPPGEWAALTAALEETDWPELTAYPNREAVNFYDGSAPLAVEAGALAEKVARWRQERDDARAQAGALRELARLRQKLAASRRFGWLRALGFAKDLAADTGKTPAEKLEHLRAAIARRPWLKESLHNA